MMQKSKKIGFTISLIIITGIWFSQLPTSVQKSAHTNLMGDISVSEPLWGADGVVVVFVDTNKISAKNLGKRIAALHLNAVIGDSARFLQNFTDNSKQCLNGNQVSDAINNLKKTLPDLTYEPLIIAGIEEGALIPFIHAQTSADPTANNLSVGFSTAMPANLLLCPPYSSKQKAKQQYLATSPSLNSKWRSVWADQPPDETGVFIRSLGNTDTEIGPYDTPLDTLLIQEIKHIIGQSQKNPQPMPVVELPGDKSTNTVTIFYSGDGGWRDLDRTVAEEMLKQNYPVVGVDVLQYFWSPKTAEQAAADLSASMAYYRQNWHTNNFVLAGYSFGADILPVIYNHLSQQDQDSVSLLVLLALAKDADFEIHVSGWLGQKSSGQPLLPELSRIPKQKLLCVYGKEEITETACTSLENTAATILELPGGHHFDQDYPKLTKQLLDVYRQHKITD